MYDISDQMDPVPSAPFLFFCLVRYSFMILGSTYYLRGNWAMEKCRGRKKAAFKYMHIKKTNDRSAAVSF